MARGEANEVEGLSSSSQQGEPRPDEEGNHKVLVAERVDDVIDGAPDFGDEGGNGQEPELAVDRAKRPRVGRRGKHQGS